MLLLPLTYKNPCHCWLTRVCCHTLTKPDCLAPLQNSTLMRMWRKHFTPDRHPRNKVFLAGDLFVWTAADLDNLQTRSVTCNPLGSSSITVYPLGLWQTLSTLQLSTQTDANSAPLDDIFCPELLDSGFSTICSSLQSRIWFFIRRIRTCLERERSFSFE